jgi:mannose-6-phosphate isomerase-like protein (cupin superfamily)
MIHHQSLRRHMSRFTIYVFGFASGVFFTLAASGILHRQQSSSFVVVGTRTAVPLLPGTKNGPISRIWQTDDIVRSYTSHGSTKKQIIQPFQLHPNLAGISVAYLEPGQDVEQHVHPSMHEFMFVLDGSMTVKFHEHEKRVCGKNCLFHGAPTEPHSFQPDPVSGVQFLLVQLTTHDTNNLQQ